jgi:hypothetical protein
MCVSFFSTTSVKIVLFLSLVNLSEWPSSCTQIHMLVFKLSVWCSSPNLMKTEMCQYMLAKFPRITFNKMFLSLLNLFHTDRHTQWWSKQAHIYNHSWWTNNYMVQLSSESRWRHSKTRNTLLLENVNFHNYAYSVWQMTYNFNAIYIKQSNEWVSASKFNKCCISLHNSAIIFQQTYNPASKLNKCCISLHNSAIIFQQTYNHYNS